MTQSSGAERAKKKGVPISQVLYLGPMVRCRTSPQPSFAVRSCLKPLISGGFAASRRRSGNTFSRCSKKAHRSSREKDFTGELFLEQYLIG
jgi:hypothetical protein